MEFAFFPRTSQGLNALSRPGLEPGSSDSEPSALTTGLLDKAVALACPRYSWPRMLKVAPCTVVRSYIQIFSAWWVTTILYNYGATLSELRYKPYHFRMQMSHLSFETRLPRSQSIFLLTPFLPLQTYAVSIFQSAEMTRAIDLFYSYSELPYAKNLSKSLYLWSRKKKHHW